MPGCQNIYRLEERTINKMIIGIPAGELEETYRCSACGSAISEKREVYFLRKPYCERCVDKAEAAARKKAWAYARKNCKIKGRGKLPQYDDELEYRCTPQEYRDGAKESYTPNAFLAWLRHSRTNYESLIKKLDRGDNLDQILYQAIRDRIDNMIIERAKLPMMGCEED